MPDKQLSGGWPTDLPEAGDLLQDLLQPMMAAAELDHVGVFRYSHEDGTHSGTMEDTVEAEVIEARAEEIDAFLRSMKSMYPRKKLTVIFQPHLYTRTRDFASGFSKSLSLADEVVLMVTDTNFLRPSGTRLKPDCSVDVTSVAQRYAAAGVHAVGLGVCVGQRRDLYPAQAAQVGQFGGGPQVRRRGALDAGAERATGLRELDQGRHDVGGGQASLLALAWHVDAGGGVLRRDVAAVGAPFPNARQVAADVGGLAWGALAIGTGRQLVDQARERGFAGPDTKAGPVLTWLAGVAPLRPAMRWTSEVRFVKPVAWLSRWSFAFSPTSSCTSTAPAWTPRGSPWCRTRWCSRRPPTGDRRR